MIIIGAAPSVSYGIPMIQCGLQFTEMEDGVDGLFHDALVHSDITILTRISS